MAALLSPIVAVPIYLFILCQALLRLFCGTRRLTSKRRSEDTVTAFMMSYRKSALIYYSYLQ